MPTGHQYSLASALESTPLPVPSTVVHVTCGVHVFAFGIVCIRGMITSVALLAHVGPEILVLAERVVIPGSERAVPCEMTCGVAVACSHAITIA